MKLIIPHFREVGMESIVEVHPSKQWLGVNIIAFSLDFILVLNTFVQNHGLDWKFIGWTL